MGRAMFHIAGAFAELEREIIRERVRAGLANARRRGKRLGRRPLLLNHEKIAKLASNGLSGHAIAREIGVSEYTIRRILKAGRVKNPSTTAPSTANDFAGFRSTPQRDL